MRQTIRRALGILKTSDIDHLDEVTAITSQIILAENNDSQISDVNGASSFQSWGAILLCADESRDEIDILQAIVHETAHLVLFAEAMDEPLVLNDPIETYSSPLRLDPRPMDGIYHATFVSTRMCQAVFCAFKNLKHDKKVKEHLKETILENRKNFSDGYEVIREYGELTPLGEKLITGAADYMKKIDLSS